MRTMEGFRSHLRSWLRPHRGLSQKKLPLYLGFFAFVDNSHKRGKALLPALVALLVRSDAGLQEEQQMKGGYFTLFYGRCVRPSRSPRTWRIHRGEPVSSLPLPPHESQSMRSRT